MFLLQHSPPDLSITLLKWGSFCASARDGVRMFDERKNFIDPYGEIAAAELNQKSAKW